MWEIEFINKENGRCPAIEFIESDCSSEEKVLIVNAIEQLGRFGNGLKRPYVDHIKDGIYELRLRVKNTQFRFLYFFAKEKIIITQGFKKKRSTIPPGELSKAKEYSNIYLEKDSR
jgi:phage-related protein